MLQKNTLKSLNTIKKFFAILGFLIIGLGIILFITIQIVNEDIPKIISTKQSQQKASELIQKSLVAFNQQAWKKTVAIEFSFRDKIYHLWYKKKNLSIVEWGSDDNRYKVMLNTKTIRGKVWHNKVLLKEKRTVQKYLKKAYSYHTNDTFWLNPILHANSPGAKVDLIKNDKSQRKVLVSYTSGGVTPGDSYLFDFNLNGSLDSMKMWVSILPVKGVKATFVNYKKYANGLLASNIRKIWFLKLNLVGLKFYTSAQEIEKQFLH